MERALDLEALAVALGGRAARHSRLPSAEQLQALMAETEIRLFAGRPNMNDELVHTAWYLHGVASASVELGVYDEARRRRAFQISAHVFDLALHSPSLARDERLRLAFAAQVGYHRGELQPNAMAIWRRVQAETTADIPLLDHVHTVALEAGVGILGLGRRHLYKQLVIWRRQLRSLRADIGIEALAETMFGAADAVVDGAYFLLQFLTFGDRQNLERARSLFTRAMTDDASAGDLDGRWVAAHLHNLSGEMDSGSVWALLPPDLPRSAYQALTVTDPPVLTLWPPQRALLASRPSALDPNTKRAVLSLPTSAGKTLLAQLIIVAHLAKAGTSVCYVAPLRSLGREVRRALRSRLAPLRRELGRDLPDSFLDGSYSSLEPLMLLEADEAQPDVEIMTPERLSHLLRNDADAVLDRFGLFIFDEAHLVGEPGRGFNLEGALSFLHWRTITSEHRLVLLSAALGNRGQLMTWLDPGSSGLLYDSEWRGPRRLNAIFTTRVDWQRYREEPVRSQAYPVRRFYPLYGDIRIRPAENASTQQLQLTHPVGEIAFRVNERGERERNRQPGHSTPTYKAVAQVASAVAHAGSVLIVNSTRDGARRMAEAIADRLEDSGPSRSLAEFVRLRVGAEHPLSRVLQKGVAYHHAALPIDVLEAIEEGVRIDAVRFLSSTTSLTEGVNLPVRTVIVAETAYEGQPTGALLRGARLLNAIGRAGRACKECEGWVILATNQSPSPTDFTRLAVDADDLQVDSFLSAERTLHALAELDRALLEDEDAVFQTAAEEARDFVAFVWFLLTADEDRGIAPAEADLEGALSSTLGFVQISPPQRALLLRVASGIRHSYESSDPDRRRRWARFGTSVSSGRVIDALAYELANQVKVVDEAGLADTAVDLLVGIRAFERLYTLPEAPREWRFLRNRSGGPVDPQPPLQAVLRDWIHGEAMPRLADRYLVQVKARDYRIEQIVDATSQHFEHYLAWTVGSIFDQANRQLQEEGHEPLCCPDLPLFIRYGVDSAHALELLTSGFRSREMAKEVADKARDEAQAVVDLRAWLGAMTVAEWRERFGANPSDLLDLLEYTRIRRGHLLQKLLETGEAVIELDDDTGMNGDAAILEPEGGLAPSPLVIRRQSDGMIVSRVPTGLHADVQAVLDIGLDLSVSFHGTEVRLSLAEELS